MTAEPYFPSVFDSSMLSAWKSCQTLFKHIYLEDWKSKGENVHRHAGKAFATALEVARTSYYVDKQTSDSAVAAGLAALVTAYGDFQCPPDSAKSLERMCGATSSTLITIRSMRMTLHQFSCLRARGASSFRSLTRFQSFIQSPAIPFCTADGWTPSCLMPAEYTIQMKRPLRLLVLPGADSGIFEPSSPVMLGVLVRLELKPTAR